MSLFHKNEIIESMIKVVGIEHFIRLLNENAFDISDSSHTLYGFDASIESFEQKDTIYEYSVSNDYREMRAYKMVFFPRIKELIYAKNQEKVLEMLKFLEKTLTKIEFTNLNLWEIIDCFTDFTHEEFYFVAKSLGDSTRRIYAQNLETSNLENFELYKNLLSMP